MLKLVKCRFLKISYSHIFFTYLLVRIIANQCIPGPEEKSVLTMQNCLFLRLILLKVLMAKTPKIFVANDI